jgi:hypothetical protein
VLVEALTSKIAKSKGSFRVRIAEALFVLTGERGWTDPICEVLERHQPRWRHWGPRVDAAIALADLPTTARVVDALVHGVQDREYLVRRHSAQALLVHGAKRTPIDDHATLWSQIGSTQPALWSSAAAELGRLPRH